MLRISIVIPSYQQADYLRATLDSVLSQDIPEVEVIVRDGGSTDGSVEILREYESQIIWVSCADYGQAHAINEGLRGATGEIVAYLNSDDVYYAGSLAKIRAYFSEHPECWFLYGDADHLHADGSLMEPYYSEPWDYERLQDICFICQPALFWRREALERFGFFDDTLHYALDYEYWLRAGREVPFHYLQGERLAGSRLHDQTKTLGQRVKVHREILQAVMRHSTRPASVLRWLKHLAHYHADEEGRAAVAANQSARPYPYYFVQGALKYAHEFGIALDEATLAEWDGMLREIGV
ncbi:MAG: glycosyltransferase [Gammaproteobacteria bacterium]|nr:glycosyltransferase [Gammaproteobacteria bacterium]